MRFVAHRFICPMIVSSFFSVDAFGQGQQNMHMIWHNNVVIQNNIGIKLRYLMVFSMSVSVSPGSPRITGVITWMPAA